MSNLKKHAISGVKYFGLGQCITQLCRLVTLALLAILLTPVDFGLVGLATIVTGFVGVFKDFGTGASIVRQDNLKTELLSTVFFFNLCIALLLSGAVFLVAPSIGTYFEEAQLIKILRYLSFAIFASSFSVVPQAILKFRLDFRSLAGIEVVAALFSCGVGLAMAALGFGVWSLVFQTIASTIIVSLASWHLAKWTPKLTFSKTELIEVFSFSTNLTCFSILNYFARNADNFLIGKLLGKEALGLYTLAYRLMLFPVQNIATVVTKIMYPIFAKTKDDNQKFRRGYLQIIRTISLITFPAMVGTFVVAVPLVDAYLGGKWSVAGWLLMILAPVGLVQSIASSVGAIYKAKGKTGIMFGWGLITSIVVVLGFVFGIQFGVFGVAVSYLATTTFLVIPCFFIPCRLIDLSLGEVFRSVQTNLLCSLLMGIFAWAIGYWVGLTETSIKWTVVIQIVAGIVSYLVLTCTLNVSLVKSISEQFGLIHKWRAV